MLTPFLAQAAAQLSAAEQEKIQELFSEPFMQAAVRTWIEGGWVMIPLAIGALFLYYEAASTMRYLGRTGVTSTPAKTWMPWITRDAGAQGYIAETIRYVMAGKSRREILDRIEAVRLEVIPRANLKIVTLNVLVAVSPLMGLLGTVIGMLATFGALSSGGGQTVDLVADGIRVALITTQAGLTIAIPGYIVIAEVVRRRNAFNTFLAQLENAALQAESTRSLPA